MAEPLADRKDVDGDAVTNCRERPPRASQVPGEHVPLGRLDAIDWTTVENAWAEPSKAPEVLRAFVAAEDAAARYDALNDLYLDLLDDMVADAAVVCLPFLFELALDTAVAGRGGLLEFIETLAEAAETGVEMTGGVMPELPKVITEDERCDLIDDISWGNGIRIARRLRERLGELSVLLSDPAPEVRGVAARLLARHVDDPGALLPSLLERAAVEDDQLVRHMLAQALGALVARLRDEGLGGTRLNDAAPNDTALTNTMAEDPARPVVAALVRLAASGGDAAATFSALENLARYAPADLPADTVERVIARFPDIAPAPIPYRPDEPLWNFSPRNGYSTIFDARECCGYVLDPRVRADETLYELIRSLNDEVTYRQRILLARLGQSEEPDFLSGVANELYVLHNGWRVPDPERSAEALTPLLTHENRRLAEAAASALRHGRLPMTPDMLDAAFRGGHVEPLVAAGDPRACELLAERMPRAEGIEHVVRWCEQLGPRAAGLTSLLRHRARTHLDRLDLSGDTNPYAEANRTAVFWAPTYLAALLAAGSDDLPDAVALLEWLAERAASAGKALHPKALILLDIIGGLGRRAAPAVPVLRRLLHDRDADARVLAARALWHAGDDPAPLFPVLGAVLDERREWNAQRRALELVTAMGQAASPLLPRLRALVPDAPTPRSLLTLRAVDPSARGETDEPLRQAWLAQRGYREDIAGCLHRERAQGRESPAAFDALLRAELAEPRRVGNTSTPNDRANHRFDADADERLRALCQALLSETTI